MAKWYSYKYKIPVLLTAFKYSDTLALSNYEVYLNDDLKKNFKHYVPIRSEQELVNQLKKSEPTLFEVSFRASVELGYQNKELPCLPKTARSSLVYFAARRYPEYGAELKKSFKPLKDLRLPSFPKDFITVAMHVRKGSCNDTPLSSCQYLDEDKKVACSDEKKMIDRRFPLKFPPEQYYADQIIKLSDVLNEAPLYVYIFTDDKNPELIVSRLKKRVDRQNIVFACHQGPNNYSNNLIDDIYVMATFDCLIRPDSYFSWISQMVGSHKLIIFPQKAKWINDHMLMMTDVGIIFCDQKTNETRYLGFNCVTAEHRKLVKKLLLNKQAFVQSK
jgi:hypothetical protein